MKLSTKNKPRTGEVWNMVGGGRVSILDMTLNATKSAYLLMCSDDVVRTANGIAWSPVCEDNTKDLVSKVKPPKSGEALVEVSPLAIAVIIIVVVVSFWKTYSHMGGVL